MTTAATQLTLSITPQDIYRLDNFLFIQAELKQAVSAFCSIESSTDFLLLHGQHGLGKTHLLNACAESFKQQGKQVMYLPMEVLVKEATPELLEGLEQLDMLCLDDVDAIEGKEEWEQALFHCFNRLKQRGVRLLVSAVTPPTQSEIGLPDLRSRLATALILALQPLTDEQKQQALMLQAGSYGLMLADDVAQYLLRHHGRSMPELMQSLAQLDRASLQDQRKLTIPFIKQVL